MTTTRGGVGTDGSAPLFLRLGSARVGALLSGLNSLFGSKSGGKPPCHESARQCSEKSIFQWTLIRASIEGKTDQKLTPKGTKHSGKDYRYRLHCSHLEASASAGALLL